MDHYPKGGVDTGKRPKTHSHRNYIFSLDFFLASKWNCYNLKGGVGIGKREKLSWKPYICFRFYFYLKMELLQSNMSSASSITRDNVS